MITRREGKCPHFDRAFGEGKRQDMAGVSRSNSPGGPASVVAGLVPPPAPGLVRADPVTVRKLQRRLWAAARQSRSAGSTLFMTVFTGVDARNHVKKIIGKPYAGKPHVRN